MTFEEILKPSLDQLNSRTGTGDNRIPLSLPAHIHSRIAELETENNRLQRLVAELILKNQKLRGVSE
jgi:hypothetical protein